MAKPSKLPAWDTTEVNSVEPDTTHQDEGWLAPGGIPEKPPFQTFNHWMNTVWKWIKEFNRQGIVEWDGVTTYQIDDITKGSDGFLYTSLVINNTNNNPTLEPTKWSPLVSKTGGFKNLIIDGQKQVNPDAYAGGVLADGVYGYAMWKGANSDVDIEQVIEQKNIRTGTYTISWVGGGTATVDGTSGLSSGDSLSITVSGNVSVIVPKAATDIMLEPGSVKSDFEQTDIEVETSKSQRYYELVIGQQFYYLTNNSGSQTQRQHQNYSVEKRAVATISFLVISGAGTIGGTADNKTTGFLVNFGGAIGNQVFYTWTADARL
jgi:hypothetical protein